MKDRLRFVAGAVMLAAALYGLLALPGLVSDRDSLVPVAPAGEEAGPPGADLVTRADWRVRARCALAQAGAR